MKSYKVKINCPLFLKYSRYVTDELGFIYLDNMVFEPALYPDVFEEIKEPLFVTEDGVEIHEPSTLLWDVDTCDFEIECNRFDETDKIKQFKFFSTKEAAEKWIEENKPMFSKKQIMDAITKHMISKDAILSGFVFNESLIKELGL